MSKVGKAFNVLPRIEEARRLAEAGDYRHALLVSFYCYTGVGTQRSEAASDYWFSKASVSKDPEYLCQLGELRQRGELIKKDFNSAHEFYSTAMLLDKAKGAYMLAMLALDESPNNPFKDTKAAVSYLRKALENGHLLSRIVLLQMHMRAGWRFALRACLPLMRAVVEFQSAVFAGQRDALWRYSDVFRVTRIRRRHIGDGRKYLAPRTLDEVLLDRLAPRG